MRREQTTHPFDSSSILDGIRAGSRSRRRPRRPNRSTSSPTSRRGLSRLAGGVERVAGKDGRAITSCAFSWGQERGDPGASHLDTVHPGIIERLPFKARATACSARIYDMKGGAYLAYILRKFAMGRVAARA